MASLLGEVFKFGVGAATAEPRQRGFATAGTPSKIAPTIGQRFLGGIESLSVTQDLRAGEAAIGRTQSQEELNRARAQRDVQAVLDKNEPVDLNKVLGANFTPKVTQTIVDQARLLGADIDGNNIISAQEFNRILPKFDPQFLQDTIGQGTQDTRTILDQNIALLKPEIEKATKIVPGLTLDNVEEMFQNNPSLATTFPKIAEALQGQTQLQQRISNLTQAGEMAKRMGGKQKAKKFKVIKDELGNVIGVDEETLERFSVPRQDEDVRPDGTRKGKGFLGELRRPDGKVSTELSIDVEVDGQRMLIPMIVSTSTQNEINSLLNNEEPTKEIIDKAVSHAIGRINRGLSPFAQEGEQRQPFITARELGKATGPLSGGAAFLSRIIGVFFPGEQFSNIQSARNKVRNLNKKIVQTLVLSKRFPVFEQAQIQGFLVDPSSFTADPGGASGKTLDFKEFILREKQGLETQLGQTISAEQRINITGKLGNINQVLNLLPGNLELKIASGREITVDDIINMSLGDIRNFPASEARFLPREIKLEMLRRLETGQGITSGGF